MTSNIYDNLPAIIICRNHSFDCPFNAHLTSCFVNVDNIQQLLINNETIERIDAASQHLNEQSMAFKTQSKQLKDRMWWQMWRTRLIVIAVVMIVLVIIIVPAAVIFSNK
jgi:hypothetical protein